MPGSSEFRLCPAEEMTQKISKKFENYKKAVYKLDELLSDRGDSNDDIKRKVRVDTTVDKMSSLGRWVASGGF